MAKRNSKPASKATKKPTKAVKPKPSEAADPIEQEPVWRMLTPEEAAASRKSARTPIVPRVADDWHWDRLIAVVDRIEDDLDEAIWPTKPPSKKLKEEVARARRNYALDGKDRIRHLRNAINSGNMAVAVLGAFAVAHNYKSWGETGNWEAIIRGRKTVQSASMGGKTRRKLTDQQRSDAREMRERLMIDNPSETDVCKQVGEQFGVSYKTLTRRRLP